MGRATQFFDYINKNNVPEGGYIWSYSHLTITPEIKTARTIHRKNMSAHKNESTGMFELICDQCKRTIYNKLTERKYSEDPANWTKPYVCMDCVKLNDNLTLKPDMFKLSRPLCFFDTETTGVNPAKDRIVSIAVIKFYPDGRKDSRYMVLDPEMPIPAEATEVHGITDEMVKGKPKFRQIASALHNFLLDSDLGGYNISFDIPLLAEEFERYNAYLAALLAEVSGNAKPLEFPIPGTRIVDSCVIFKKKEERTLSAAVKFYLGKDMEDAHNAQADTQASYDVLVAQLERYPDLKEMSFDEVVEFCKYDGPERIDLKGVFVIDGDGDPMYGSGKHKDKKVQSELGYLSWMVYKSEPGIYTQNTLKIARRLLERYGPSKQAPKAATPEIPYD